MRGATNSTGLLDEEVTFTPNGTYVASISRKSIRFDGRYVVGSIQINITSAPNSYEFVIGTLSKSAKYSYASYHACVTTGGKVGFLWMENNSIKCWINGGVNNEDMGFPLYFLAKGGGGAVS